MDATTISTIPPVPKVIAVLPPVIAADEISVSDIIFYYLLFIIYYIINNIFISFTFLYPLYPLY